MFIYIKNPIDNTDDKGLFGLVHLHTFRTFKKNLRVSIFK